MSTTISPVTSSVDPMAALVATMSEQITANVTASVMPAIDAKLSSVDAALSDALTGADLRVTGPASSSKTVAKAVLLKGPKHKALKQLIQIAAHRLPVLLVGPAGTGKTYACEQVAEALGLPFYAMSVGAQTSKADLMGFIHAGGHYVSTMFRQAFEHGGVFLMDELDAGNSNVLVQLNAALSNGYCAFPDSDTMIKKHPDFCFVASANTYGNGASRQYVGRNQLDAATLDRFVVLNFDLDTKLESALAGETDTATKWLSVVKQVRAHIESEGIRALVTPRATIKGLAMLDAGIGFRDTLQAVVLSGIPIDKHKYIIGLATESWGKIEPLDNLVVNDPMGVLAEPETSESERELTESPF